MAYSASLGNGLLRYADDVHLVFQHTLHVVILILDLGCDNAFAVDCVQAFCRIQHHLLAQLEHSLVMVADDIGKRGFLNGSLEGAKMEETFVSVRLARHFIARHQAHKLVGDETGIYHLVLGISGMYIASLDADLGTGRIEVLILQLAHFTTIHGVSPFATELLHIKEMCASANLFIGIECHTDFSVLNLGMRHQILHGCHNLGNTSLVIRAQKSVTVSYNQVLTNMVLQFGKLGHAGYNACLGIQHHIRAVIIGNDTRFHVGSAAIGAGIHVADETNCGDGAFRIGRQGGIDIAVAVHLHFRQSQFLQFLHQVFGQGKLLLRAGASLGILAALGIKRNVFQETIYQCFFHNGMSIIWIKRY